VVVLPLILGVWSVLLGLVLVREIKEFGMIIFTLIGLLLTLALAGFGGYVLFCLIRSKL